MMYIDAMADNEWGTYFSAYLANAAIISVGRQKCQPGHSYAGVREHYILHFIISGTGTYYLRQKKYELRAGQGFAIFPGIINRYEASHNDPWHYFWLNFSGPSLAEAMKSLPVSQSEPILHPAHPETIDDQFRAFLEKTEPLTNTRANALTVIGLYYELLAEFCAPLPLRDPKKKDWYRKARAFIDRNFTTDIAVKDVVRMLLMDRTYISREFKRLAGTSMQSYIQDKRMAKACEFLRYSEMTINEIASSVGFRDYATFARLFKSKTGAAPGTWRTGGRE